MAIMIGDKDLEAKDDGCASDLRGTNMLYCDSGSFDRDALFFDSADVGSIYKITSGADGKPLLYVKLSAGTGFSRWQLITAKNQHRRTKMNEFLIARKADGEILWEFPTLTMANHSFLAMDHIEDIKWAKDVDWLSGTNNCAYVGRKVFVSHISEINS